MMMIIMIIVNSNCRSITAVVLTIVVVGVAIVVVIGVVVVIAANIVVVTVV